MPRKKRETKRIEARGAEALFPPTDSTDLSHIEAVVGRVIPNNTHRTPDE